MSSSLASTAFSIFLGHCVTLLDQHAQQHHAPRGRKSLRYALAFLPSKTYLYYLRIPSGVRTFLQASPAFSQYARLLPCRSAACPLVLHVPFVCGGGGKNICLYSCAMWHSQSHHARTNKSQVPTSSNQYHFKLPPSLLVLLVLLVRLVRPYCALFLCF